MNENYPKTLLNFGPLKCSRLGQKFIQYFWCLSQKEFVKSSFISLFKCIGKNRFNFISVWSEIMSLKIDRLELGFSIHEF